MTTVREIVTPDATCIEAGGSILDSAGRTTDPGAGALPICGSDALLQGVFTGWDIVVKVLGAGKDSAACTAGEFARGEAVTLEALSG
ncbi:hypothetical protein [Streptomyces sp. NPDC018711]|uniref:hypothetical protein n=1 Tax=Streptomyces sp. NPDC018711 TaxID=3365052 RepID=UPI0037A2835D